MKAFLSFKICFVLFLMLITGRVNAQEIEWAVGIYGNFERGTAVTSKGKFVYHAGLMGNQTVFGQGETRETTLDGANYVARYKQSGAVSWAKAIEGTGLHISGIDVDGAGNVYIAGKLSSSVTFGPGELMGATIDEGLNISDMIIAKYNSKGFFQWVRQAGDVSSVEVKDLVVDNAGNSYVVGSYRDNITFGADGNTTPVDLFAAGIAPDNDIYIVKYDTQGDLVWAKTAGGDGGYDRGIAIDLDVKNNIYVAGSFVSNARFGDVYGEWINVSSYGERDGFLAKYSPDGEPLWAVVMGGDENDNAYAIANKDGDTIIAGKFTEVATFESTNKVGAQLTEQNTENMFFARYNSSGVLEWVKGIYAANHWNDKIDVGFGTGDQSCVAANYQDEATFGLGELNQITLTSPGDEDQYFACYSATGAFQWVEDDPTPMHEAMMPGNGEILVTGAFQGNVFFGPLDPNDVLLIGQGLQNAYVAKYRLDSPELGLQWEKESGIMDVLDAPNSSGSPTEFILSSNYPNPFNPQTTIRFGMPESAQVSLKVYDMSGREIATLINGQMAAGFHEVAFEAGDIPSGMYLYRLTSPAGELTKLMSLIK